MSGQVFSGVLTLPKASATALANYLRVKLTAGLIVVAGIADQEVGTLEKAALDGETKATVRPMRDQAPVRRFVASAAVTQYALVYPAAGGKVSSTQNGSADPIGWALVAASGDGAVISVLRLDVRAMS